MALQTINVGTPNGNNGDFIRNAMIKVNENFTEIYPIDSAPSPLNVVHNTNTLFDGNPTITVNTRRSCGIAIVNFFIEAQLIGTAGNDYVYEGSFQLDPLLFDPLNDIQYAGNLSLQPSSISNKVLDSMTSFVHVNPGYGEANTFFYYFIKINYSTINSTACLLIGNAVYPLKNF